MLKKWIPTLEAYRLLHEGQLALSEIEANGVRVDKAYLEGALDRTATEINLVEDQMRLDPDYKYWRRRYGESTNLGSAEQLARVLVEELKCKPKYDTHGNEWTTDSKGRASASKESLESIDRSIVKLYFNAQRLRKSRDTFLVGIHRELVQHADGLWYVHPTYHLNTVSTFRSSSSCPNFQNQPTRDPIMAEIVRRSYIPRPGRCIIEVDLGQIEVRLPCPYCFDPNLIAYCSDSTKDMHRDVGSQIFIMSPEQIARNKPIRHIAKNQFVFPTIYGSYYAQMTPDLWDASARLTIDGTPKTVRQHLADNGITERGPCDPRERPVQGTLEYHIKQIEDHFWGERFPVFAQWKRDWYEKYLREGGCRFLTGFVMVGPHAKNDITNYPVQGAAFHCMLWSLIRIIRRLRRYRMQTVVIGEIHDSIQLDAPAHERDAVIDICMSIMTEEIKKWATWLNVPLTAEPECCPIDRPWFDKAGLIRAGDGRWVPANLEKWEKIYGPWALQV